MFKQGIQTLFKKDMDRKEFLKYSGIMILSLVGITSLLRNALNHTEAFNSKSTTASKTDNIYGKE